MAANSAHVRRISLSSRKYRFYNPQHTTIGRDQVAFFPTGTARAFRSFDGMLNHESMLIEDSVQIAWDYLDLAGEIEDALSARRFLLRHVEMLFAKGVRSRLLLSNRAIAAYQQSRRDRRAA
jgi:hypothetical protein